MKTRTMWAPPFWEEQKTFAVSADVFRGCPVRVLVTEIPEGMPTLREGARVQIDARQRGTVRGLPVATDDGWKVVVDTHGGGAGAYRCDRLTPIPREVTRTIRVTGPEDAVEKYADHVQRWAEGVRVEVSDDR